jgi:ribonucleotide reductase beta subunit family protein with ferritin-like domain
MGFVHFPNPRTADEFPAAIAALAYNEKICAFAYKKISENIENSSDPDTLCNLALAADTVRRKQSWYIHAMEACEILYEKIMDHPASTV